MTHFNIADAKARFSELVQKALTGELTVISCDEIFSRYGLQRIW